VVRRRVRPKSRGNVVNGKVQDYRFVDEKRKNIPDAGLASFYRERRERKKYEYDPHLDPQLVWAGKAEHTSFEVDTVALHIHERISTKAILKVVEKKELYKQLRLFAEPDLPLDKRIEFYQHDMDWTNRLILGDSLLAMNSLIEREMMAGKVQMIYVDPPYGIKFSSNFQPRVNSREVRDDDEDLTREPEQVKAYRDTWTLGVHSYLAYLKDRLLLCYDLLAETGSIFVQIGEENVHLVRNLMDELFKPKNFISQISVFKTTTPRALLDNNLFYLLWYAKDKNRVKYHQLFVEKPVDEWARETKGGSWGCTIDGISRPLTPEEKANVNLLPIGAEVYQLSGLTSAGAASENQPFVFRGKTYFAGKNSHWKTSVEGLNRLASLGRIEVRGGKPWFIKYHKDFPLKRLTNVWTDTSGKATERLFVVQTQDKVIERCILMTTDPSDLVLDPTCGSGTSAYLAEKWGRRWITCDTSRVALAISRQRIMTALFSYYKLAHPEEGIRSGFEYQTVSHVTLKALARNETPKTETLYDKPMIERDRIRVSGPLTVEAIPAPAIEDPSLLPALEQETPKPSLSANVAEDYINTMIDLLRKDGVTFPGAKRMTLENVRPMESAGFLHAEAQAKQNGDYARVAMSFGPRHGPVTAKQVEEAVRSAYMMGFNILIFAGFAFDPEAQATIQKTPHPNLHIQMAHISPDVEMHDLLKSPKGSQLFTVFGQPDIRIKKTGDEYAVELLGVDIYDPITGEVHPSRPEDVVAWFLDQNYEGYTFCITQAFFPKEATNRNPWDKLENALHGIIDKKRIEKLRGTASLPFKAGDQKRIAVKVIDQRGNEVIVVKKLEATEG
jgi:adenine-specific DNA-methyltransferase